ncbi:phosphatidylinositol-specific phospholipase C domain-containing protein [Paraburkholderia dipogonis]|uniref:1-phosphatidylinositol phosphodiesterase n=2 Tax=Paraburkholderia dipogonis TaxID=1211383 RepID=A0A4Y8MXS7_9BURK|nr:phosphatidylinositol-specific phospholipase C [Paraburkholderia dipogonis]TFE42219.1 phosphatidylinositol-specific phospholipase C domain-containing protein [Paraburkholderia dipogonis]
MSAIDGSRLLSALTLPGSHDTCAYTVDDRLARTQHAPLDDQLQQGVRVLDIRCRHERDRFAIHHGGIPLGLTFDDVVQTCSRFLARHPGECIVMSVKDEWPARDCTRTFAATFEWYVGRRADVRWHLAADLPLLQSVRGGIVLLRRFPSDKPLGMDLTAWPDNATFDIDHAVAPFSIQDEFRVPVPISIASKWRAVGSLLDLAPRLCGERWVINFCSGTGMAAPPAVVAFGDTRHRGIHERLAERLAARSEPCGTMMLDFCDWQDWRLVHALIDCNWSR